MPYTHTQDEFEDEIKHGVDGALVALAGAVVSRAGSPVALLKEAMLPPGVDPRGREEQERERHRIIANVLLRLRTWGVTTAFDRWATQVALFAKQRKMMKVERIPNSVREKDHGQDLEFEEEVVLHQQSASGRRETTHVSCSPPAPSSSSSSSSTHPKPKLSATLAFKF